MKLDTAMTKTPATHAECARMMRAVFLGYGPYQERYHEIRVAVYARTDEYSWKDLRAAEAEYRDMRARCEARMRELSALTGPLRKKAKAEKAAAEKRRLEEARRPVDLTNPKVKRAYTRRVRDAAARQRRRQLRELAKAEDALRQFLALPRAERDKTPKRPARLQNRIERIKWALRGGKLSDAPQEVHDQLRLEDLQRLRKGRRKTRRRLATFQALPQSERDKRPEHEAALLRLVSRYETAIEWTRGGQKPDETPDFLAPGWDKV